MFKENKVNWKKEGYKVGDTVLLVLKKYNFNTNQFEYSNLKDLYEVTHVGTKVLKVKHKDYYNKSKYEFRSRTTRSAIFGHSYAVFKNEEEYSLYRQKEDRLDRLRDELTKKVKRLPLETLEYINQIIENS